MLKLSPLASQVGAEEAERRIRAANEPYKLEILQVRACIGGCETLA